MTKELSARGVDFEFHVAGAGSERDEILAGMTAAAGPRIHDHGRIDVWDVPMFLADKHLFIQTSEFEGTSISLLEAMGNGVAPVVTDVASGVPDLIQHGIQGWRIPIGRMDLMAEQIAALATDRDRIAVAARAAWGVVRERYNIETAARRLLEVCRLASGRPRGPFHVDANHPQLDRLDRIPLPSTLVRWIRRIRSAM